MVETDTTGLADDYIDIEINLSPVQASYKSGDIVCGEVKVTPKNDCKGTVAVSLVETECLISNISPEQPVAKSRQTEASDSITVGNIED